MLDYNKKLEQLQRLINVKKAIQSFASEDALNDLNLNFNNTIIELLDSWNKDEKELVTTKHILKKIEADFYDRVED